MFNYIKDLPNIFKIRKDIKPIGEGLTKQQKKKYAKQYRNLSLRLTVLSIVYILGIMESIYMTFEQNSPLGIAIVVLIARDYNRIAQETKHEATLIQQRIQKRKQKNKKTPKQISQLDITDDELK